MELFVRHLRHERTLLIVADNPDSRDFDLVSRNLLASEQSGENDVKHTERSEGSPRLLPLFASTCPPSESK